MTEQHLEIGARRLLEGLNYIATTTKNTGGGLVAAIGETFTVGDVEYRGILLGYMTDGSCEGSCDVPLWLVQNDRVSGYFRYYLAEPIRELETTTLTKVRAEDVIKRGIVPVTAIGQLMVKMRVEGGNYSAKADCCTAGVAACEAWFSSLKSSPLTLIEGHEYFRQSGV